MPIKVHAVAWQIFEKTAVQRRRISGWETRRKL